MRNPYTVAINDSNPPTQAEFDAWDKANPHWRENEMPQVIPEHPRDRAREV